MQPDDLAAPSLADIERLAQRAWEALPPEFRAPCAGLLIRVAEYADDETLDAMGVEDPLELTGLYAGVALTERSVMDVVTEPDAVWLYRMPILYEWAERGDVTLGRLIAHVLVHEIAHHFGYSDDDIAAIDDRRM